MEQRFTFRDKADHEAWQYKIRCEKERQWIESGRYRFWEDIDLTLKKAIIKPVNRKIAEKIILEYEWLGDMAACTDIFYGIFFDIYCGGVICIQKNGVFPPNALSYDCPSDKISYFARGACAFWTPNGAASKLLSYACKLEAKRGALMTIGFADTDAGEYGTVYQACGWLCLGRQKTSNWQLVKGNVVYDSRTIGGQAKSKGFKTTKEYSDWLISKGWVKQFANKKYVYINILDKGENGKRIYEKVKERISDYPKRGDSI